MTSTRRYPVVALLAVVLMCLVDLQAIGERRRPSSQRRVESTGRVERRSSERAPERRRDERRRENERRTEARNVPAANSPRVTEARASAGARLARARERLNERLPGPRYQESRFDVKGKSETPLRTQIYTSFEGGRFTNRQLERNETFYRYFGTSGGRKVSWLTNKRYTNETELRHDLALTREMSANITRMTTYDVPKGTWVSEGRAASQGRGYEGGGYQATIANVPRAWKVREDRFQPAS